MQEWVAGAASLVEWLIAWLQVFWPAIVATAGVVAAVLVTLHVAQHKRDARAAAAWTGLVWLVPLVGALLYLLLGVNRIQRRARQLTGGGAIDAALSAGRDQGTPLQSDRLRVLARLVGRLTGLPLTGGNRVTLLEAGPALAAMIQAVDQARDSVLLATYIFGNDAAGKPLAEALERAVARGVTVRVLVDGVGALYSLPPITLRLRRRGVRVERFLHSIAPWRMPYLNLRNHRKLMVVDRCVGFTGGMNIRAGYLREPAQMQDLHARVEGPAVVHLLRSFVADWAFTCGETLDDNYLGALDVGGTLARGINAGPDADFDKRRLTLLAAIGAAEHEVRIVTPYFVPDQTLLASLQLALLKGVRVNIVVPQKNNLRLVQWASLHALRWLVREGAELHFSAPPFDHTKLMTVDGHWVLLGSGNWDARSLRLNFEFDMECYDDPLAEQANDLIDRRLRGARRVGEAEFRAMGRLRHVRNALAHLFEPYL
ncbi:phospholipase D-like domain-containing protein [Alloalcanivorax venustensis]|jgi:cardiolipin synthase A/B|uniref:phospholipase D-like domain-containing protein n=1 Tax=Alloalcanivorax venustensis TaxID=172371 RepID=UPI0039E6E32D|tara:strand:- start:899 stop:2353 length:1455 start_codon:yes stop_codon:yes gene_type:complete